MCRLFKQIFLLIFITFIATCFLIGQSQATSQIDRGITIKKIKSHLTGKKYALVVGIDSYKTMPLEAAVADAKDVSKRLKELNFDVTSLLNEKATLKEIRHVLGTKFSMLSKNDQVVIYFAGHGVTEKLHNNKIVGYILPVDVNIKDLYSSAISMKELRGLTARIPAKHVLYVFDSCYSGLGLTRSINYNASKKDLDLYLSELAGKRAVYMITAGKADEVAREVQGHGLFTLQFLDGIAGAADNDPKDGIVQSSELGKFIAQKVSGDTGKDRTPNMVCLKEMATSSFL